jgi:hypothetical protein
MADLHTCTCERSGQVDHVFIDGCTAVPFRDVCRFEQALADPVEAQVKAAAEAFESRFGQGWDVAMELAREMLAAAAVVVLGRPPCTSCGRPLGTGTLLDRHPIASTAPTKTRVIASDGREGFSRPPLIPQAQWEDFAARYRCPACADAD